MIVLGILNSPVEALREAPLQNEPDESLATILQPANLAVDNFPLRQNQVLLMFSNQSKLQLQISVRPKRVAFSSHNKI
jgi:hypothetical protein